MGLQERICGRWQDKSIAKVVEFKVPGLYFLNARTFGLKGWIGGSHSWLVHVNEDFKQTVLEVTSYETLRVQGAVNITEDYVDNLVEYLDALKTTRKTYNFWSSNRQINYHRDTGPWFDLPCMIRAMVPSTSSNRQLTSITIPEPWPKMFEPSQEFQAV